MTTAPASPRAPQRKFVPLDLDPTDLAQVEPLYRALLDRPIESPAALEKWLLDLSELDSVLDEAGTNAHNAHSCHTEDAAIEKAYMHFVQVMYPALKPIGFELQKKFVASPHRAALKDPKLALLSKRWQADVEIFRPENIPLQTRATEVVTEYGKLCGRMTVEFRGKTYTLQQLGRFLEEPDRPTREEAWRLSSERRLRDRDATDDIFEKLLDLRGQIARNAGLGDYRAYTWKSMKRFDYTPQQCLSFADAIEKTVVPLVRELDRQRAADLGLEKLRPWDLAVDPKSRAPLRPFDPAKVDEFVTKTGRVLQHVSPPLAEQFASLKMGRNLDLESRQGKRPGGYQSSLEESREPFIFMNAAGTQGDVDTLLHESGHAFHFLAACGEPILELRQAPLEFCEVASMSMELFGADHLGEFYPDPADALRAKRQHLEGVIRFFPWMATIDTFQHWLYTNPGHTREQRTAQWLAILDRFATGAVDHTGLEPARRSMWHRQLHLFNYPFYYIEYGIAQLGALQLWSRFNRDAASALAGYRRALALGGTRPLPELFTAAGARFDFTRETLAPLMDEIGREMGRLPR
ncbi:MAG: M3 family oligoendopeptidase [Planctomycetes bacterium]|nr:M3 family oligoendopeptidase [Planctomycetota bacterium]